MKRRQFLSTALASLCASRVATESSIQHQDLRACVIGDSDRGGYGHGMHLVWKQFPDVSVVGLSEPNETGRRKHAEEAGAMSTYADYREMLQAERPDLVAVGPRWTTQHHDYLMACAEAGAHGIVEKPLATTLTEADAIVEAIASRNLKWSIGFNIRGTAAYQQAKKLLLEERIIGELLEVRGRGKEDHRAGGEDLIVLGTHVLDLMIDLMGMPAWCAADIQQDGRPARPEDVREATEPIGPIAGDRLQATFGFPDGSYGHFASMKNEGGNGGRLGLDVYGSNGVMGIRWGAVPEIRVLRSSSWTPGDGKEWELLPAIAADAEKATADGRYTSITADLIDSIGTDRLPAVSVQDGRRVMELTHAVFAAHAAGGRVTLPLEHRDHPLMAWRDG